MSMTSHERALVNLLTEKPGEPTLDDLIEMMSQDGSHDGEVTSVSIEIYNNLRKTACRLAVALRDRRASETPPPESTARAKAIPEIEQLKADVQDLRTRSEGQRAKLAELPRRVVALLDEAKASGQKQLDDWSVVFGTMAARISALEQAALRALNMEALLNRVDAAQVRIDGNAGRLRARVEDMERMVCLGGPDNPSGPGTVEAALPPEGQEEDQEADPGGTRRTLRSGQGDDSPVRER